MIHNNKVTWLASWTENIQVCRGSRVGFVGAFRFRCWPLCSHDRVLRPVSSRSHAAQGQNKYVMLAPSSRLKGENDMKKYEKARELRNHIARIREQYTVDMKVRCPAMRRGVSLQATSEHAVLGCRRCCWARRLRFGIAYGAACRVALPCHCLLRRRSLLLYVVALPCRCMFALHGASPNRVVRHCRCGSTPVLTPVFPRTR